MSSSNVFGRGFCSYPVRPFPASKISISISLLIFIFLFDRLSGITFRVLCTPFMFASFIGLLMVYRHNLHKFGPVALVQKEVKTFTFVFGSNSPIVGLFLWKLGTVHDILGEKEEAAECYRKITTTINGCQTSPRGSPYFVCLGRALFHLGHFEEALNAFEVAWKLKKKGKYSPIITRDLSLMVATLKHLHSNEESISKINDAVADLERKGCTQSLEHAKCWKLMGGVYISLGNASEAITYLEMALEIHLINEGEYPWSTAVAKIYEQIGDVYLGESNNNELALTNYHKAMEVYRRSGKSDEHPHIASLLQKVQNTSDLSIV